MGRAVCAYCLQAMTITEDRNRGWEEIEHVLWNGLKRGGRCKPHAGR